jgi:hypothetical protein
VTPDEKPPVDPVTKKTVGWTKGKAMPKVTCPNCGEKVTGGERMPKRHKTGECARKLQRDLPTGVSPVPPESTYEGDTLPPLEDLSSPEGTSSTSVDGGSGEGTPPPGPPPVDTSILADVMDPMTVWPAIAEIPNAIIDSKAPHAKTRVEIDRRKAEALHKFLPYIIPKMLLNPIGLFAIMMGIVFVLPVGMALMEERKWKAANAAPPPKAPPAEGATA